MPYSGATPVFPGNMGQGLPGQWKDSEGIMGDGRNKPSFEPDTLEWWLDRGIAAIQSKQGILRTRERYVQGDHPLPNGDPRYVRALRDFQQKAQTNYIGMVVGAITQRMSVNGFRFGQGEASNPEARANWMYNDMDSQLEGFIWDCATFGEGYLLVGPAREPVSPEGKAFEQRFAEETPIEPPPNPAEEPVDPSPSPTDPLNPGRPTTAFTKPPVEKPDIPRSASGVPEPIITVENPKICHVFPDPQRPNRALCGIRLWKDFFLDQVVAVLYFPDSTHVFLGSKEAGVDASAALSVGDFKLLSEEVNETGEVGLFRCQWRPDGKSEVDDIISVQNRINHTVLDRLVISKSQAYRQRWATGGGPQKQGTKKGNKKESQAPPLDPGSDILWYFTNPDAKFGDFEQADITQLLEAVRDDIINISQISQVPPHYLMGTIANIGGDTLTQAESSYVFRVKARSRAVGYTLEKAEKYVFSLKGNDAMANEKDTEVLWMDPAVKNHVEQADAILKESQMLASAPPFALRVLAQRMGYPPDVIDLLVEESEKFQQQKLEQEQMMMEKQLAVEEKKVDVGSDTTLKTAAIGAKAKASGATPVKKPTPGGSKSSSPRR